MATTRRDFLKISTVGGVAASVFGFDLTSAQAQVRELKIERTTQTRSTCPYCAVSCGVIIHTLGDQSRNVKATVVHVEGLSEKLDGRSRPGHFKGVTTVVAKLFEIVRPDTAYFGQKDAAQVAVIKKMVRDLDTDTEIVVCPIVREQDGLAMSSRNRYLSAEERRQALVLYRSLTRVQMVADQGEKRASALIDEGKRVIAEEPAARFDYFEIVDPVTLDAVEDVSRGALVAVAGYVGTTRLIDNIMLHGAGARK